MKSKDLTLFMNVAEEIKLPIGFYTTDISGVVQTCNEHFISLIHNQNIIKGETNCKEFFQNPNDRQERIEWFQKEENKEKWSENVLLLKNSHDEIIVRDTSYPILSKNGEITGFFGFIIDVKDEYRYGRLFDDLPIGVYEIDDNNKFVKVNKEILKILKYPKEAELIGKDVKEIYANNEELNNLIALITKPPFYVKDQKVELFTKEGERMWVKLNTFKIPKSGDHYYGREGTVIDITNEELINKLLYYVPVGFYIVKSNNGKYKVEHCNDQFAKFFGYKNKDQMIGNEPEIFFKDKEEYNKYLDAINKADIEKKPLWGYVFNGKKANGDIFSSEINSQLVKDLEGNITGRVGVIRDISEENILRERINEITSDIGAVLHTYSTVLIHISHKIEAILQCFNNDPFDLKKELDYSYVLTKVEPLRKVLSESLDKFEEILKNNQHSDVPEELLKIISEKNTIIKEVHADKVENINVPLLRRATVDIFNALNNETRKGISREEFKQIKSNINDVMNVSGLVALHEINDSVVEIEQQIRNFRDYVTEGKREKSPRISEDVSSILKSVANDFKELASRKNLEIKCDLPSEKLEVSIIKSEIVRVMSNILDNAIKYSYKRESTKSWIKITVKKDDNNRAIISFKNYGVPIHKKEIENGFIFRMGYRGIFSSDRRKMGTGFGLNDVYKTIKTIYKGEVFIRSEPADKYSNKEDYYNQPFITTVTLVLNLLNN